MPLKGVTITYNSQEKGSCQDMQGHMGKHEVQRGGRSRSEGRAYTKVSAGKARKGKINPSGLASCVVQGWPLMVWYWPCDDLGQGKHRLGKGQEKGGGQGYGLWIDWSACERLIHRQIFMNSRNQGQRQSLPQSASCLPSHPHQTKMSNHHKIQKIKNMIDTAPHTLTLGGVSGSYGAPTYITCL